jgi:hypothetical protein
MFLKPSLNTHLAEDMTTWSFFGLVEYPPTDTAHQFSIWRRIKTVHIKARHSKYSNSSRNGIWKDFRKALIYSSQFED